MNFCLVTVYLSFCNCRMLTGELTDAALRQLTFLSNTVVISRALQRETQRREHEEDISLTVKCFQSCRMLKNPKIHCSFIMGGMTFFLLGYYKSFYKSFWSLEKMIKMMHFGPHPGRNILEIFILFYFFCSLGKRQVVKSTPLTNIRKMLFSHAKCEEHKKVTMMRLLQKY